MTTDDMERVRKKAEAEAAERFSRILSGEAREADYKEIQAWRDAADVNDAAWRRVSLAWSASGTVKDYPAVRAMRAASLARKARPYARFSKGWRPVALAASLLAVIGVSLLFGGRILPETDVRVIASAASWSDEQRTAVGEIQSMKLDDGSVVTVNTDSALRTAFSAEKRQVQLSKGEAFFDVASDASRPFSVESGGVIVTAVGTAFSVRYTDEAVVVTLTEGRVSVETADGRHQAALSPGMQLRADKGGVRTAQIDAGRAVSWTSGMLDFHEAPLGSVIAEMNRYTKRPIILADPALASRPVTGLFPADDQDRFIEMLVTSDKVRVKRRTAASVELEQS